MKRAVLAALGTGMVISGAAALSIGAAVNVVPPGISRVHYDASLAGIEAARVRVMARCDEMAGSGKELCRAEAEAYEVVRVADLEASFRRDRESTRGAQRARIEARYQVERARCAAAGGVKRDRCLISAHAARGRDLLEMAAPYETRG